MRVLAIHFDSSLLYYYHHESQMVFVASSFSNAYATFIEDLRLVVLSLCRCNTSSSERQYT